VLGSFAYESNAYQNQDHAAQDFAEICPSFTGHIGPTRIVPNHSAFRKQNSFRNVTRIMESQLSIRVIERNNALKVAARIENANLT
jgi:hypothetical protein